jgi:hypothetical protein
VLILSLSGVPLISPAGKGAVFSIFFSLTGSGDNCRKPLLLVAGDISGVLRSTGFFTPKSPLIITAPMTFWDPKWEAFPAFPSKPGMPIST